MFPLDYALATCLLMTPISDLHCKAEDTIGFRHAIMQFAVHQEILTDNEQQYFFEINDVSDQNDLEIILGRIDCARNWVPLSDAMRLPDVDYIKRGMQFNCNHRSWLCEQMPLFAEPDFALTESLKEAVYLSRVWDCALDVKLENCYTPYYRRKRLNEFKDYIGDANFYNGIYPPFVPTWRFREER